MSQSSEIPNEENQSNAPLNPLQKLDKKILITGGGSGGHISAATAIIDGLRGKYGNLTEQLIYVGSNLGMEGEVNSRSMEQKIFENSDIRLIAIRAGKLQRYLSWRSVQLLFGVVGGMIDAWRLLGRENPDLIISTGGYVTVPICFVGWIKKIPIYIHEQTAAVGLTNKITGRFATRVYTSFPQSAKYFSPEKTLHVGNAVRAAVFQVDGKGEVVDGVRKMVTLKDKKPIILITGGGQGSHKLNVAVRQMLRYLIEDYQIILQTGDNEVTKDYELLKKEQLKLDPTRRNSFLPVKYIPAEQIGYVFSQTDLHVGRSGANFTYEMAVLHIPSIFIPIPWVTHNEQYENAKTLADTGLAKILPEGELTPERLAHEIKKIMARIRSGELDRAVDKASIKDMFPTNAVERILEDLRL